MKTEQIMKTKKIGILVGSLRKESFNRKMANALMQLAGPDLHCEFIEIGNLPLYNQDEDENPPLTFKTFREKIKSCDGVIFVTPEYNRSVPGVLKNAIDIGSRPYGQSAWAKKPAGVISVSPGSMGGFGANHHLRQSLVFLDMPVLQQPELYIGNASKLFNEQGTLIDEQVKTLLGKFIQSYEQWLNTVSPEQMSLFARKAENVSQPRQ
jgi:chromate reductase